MIHSLGFLFSRASLVVVFFCLHTSPLFFNPGRLFAQEPLNIIPALEAFHPGEKLEYDVSWSEKLKAGTAILEVRGATLANGKPAFSFLVTGRSCGLVDKFFRVEDRVESLFDPENMQSVSYTISERFGRKKRHRSLIFDRDLNVVRSTFNNEPAQTLAIPDGVQDGLAFLYFIRTVKDFTVGKIFAVDVHESGKNWSVEVHTLGKERVKTAAGEFETVKIMTRPLYEGRFMNKGEVVLWLTDDDRKVPVLMKSTIRVGSFVFSLKDIKGA